MRCILAGGIESTGTSTLAGILHHLGVFMGSDLRGPTRGNRKGYFEDRNFRIVMNREPRTSRLEGVNRYVDFRLKEGNDLWGLKWNEPMLMVIDELIQVLKERSIDTRFVSTRRPLMPMAKSLLAKRPTLNMGIVLPRAKRKMIDLDRALKKIGSKIPLFVVEYNDVIAFPRKNVEAIMKFAFFGLPLPPKENIEAAVGFVDPSLRHWT